MFDLFEKNLGFVISYVVIDIELIGYYDIIFLVLECDLEIVFLLLK